MNATQVMQAIDRIQSRYDPESDGGSVTWVDNQLLEIVMALIHRIDDLERKLASMEPQEHEKAGKSYAEYYYGISPKDGTS